VDDATLAQRVEVGAETVARVLDAFEGAGIALHRQRGSARQALRQHLHFGGRRRACARLRVGPVVEPQHRSGEHPEQQQKHAEDLVLPGDRQMPDEPQAPRLFHLGTRAAHLIHDRRRGQRIVAALCAAHLDLCRRLFEVGFGQDLSSARARSQEAFECECHDSSPR
jgi:hypothetical protein